MSQESSRPLPAMVEDFDEDQGRSKPETRLSAKRPTSNHPRRRSEVNVNQPKHPDAASDSGYSSHTHSTNASADVAKTIPAVRAPSPPKIVTIDSSLPPPAIDTALPNRFLSKNSEPSATNTSKDSRRRSVQIDPKDVRGTHQVRTSAGQQPYPQTTAQECRDPNCECYRRYPATTSPLDRRVNVSQAPFNDLRYSYHQHASRQPSSSTTFPVQSTYPGTASVYTSSSSARPSMRTRSRPASYHAGYGYSYYPDAHFTNAGLPPSSSQNYAQQAQYYQYPQQYPGGTTPAARYHLLSPVVASPQSPAYNVRPVLQHASTDTITPRRTTRCPAPITTHGLSSATRPYPVTSLSAGAYTQRDQASRTIGAYSDDRYERPRYADDAWPSAPRDSQMPPPILRRSSTRKTHNLVPAVEPPRESHRSHSSRSRSRTDAGVTTRTFIRYTYGDSTERQEQDRSRRDRRESSSNRPRQPSVSTATSGNDRPSTYSSNTGGYVDGGGERRNDRRTAPSEDRDRPLYETGQSSQEQTAAQAEAYQARVRGVDTPVQVTTESVARARGQSSSFIRPIMPQSNDYQPRSAVSGSSGHKSHNRSNRQSMDGSRVSRTDTGEIRFRMEQGTSIRLDDREIRVENNEIIIGNIESRQRERRHHRDDGGTEASDRHHSRSDGRRRAESEVRGRRHSRARSTVPHEREQRR